MKLADQVLFSAFFPMLSHPTYPLFSMQELGRTGPWSGTAGTGNPAASLEVREWQKGYTRLSTAAGFKITGAQISSTAYLADAVDAAMWFCGACQARMGCLTLHRSSIVVARNQARLLPC